MYLSVAEMDSSTGQILHSVDIEAQEQGRERAQTNPFLSW